MALVDLWPKNFCMLQARPKKKKRKEKEKKKWPSTKQKQTHRQRESGGRGLGSGMDREFGVSRCKLLHLEWTSSEVLLHSAGNHIQSLGIDHDGR